MNLSKRKEKEKIVFSLFLWTIGLIYTLTKGKFVNNLGLGTLDIDLITISAAYLFLAYGSLRTAIFAFGQGFIVDIYSGGLQGIYAFTYLCIFFIILIGSKSFNIKEPKGQFLLVFIAVVFKKIFTLLILWAFLNEITFVKSPIWISGSSALITAIFAPVIFYLFNRLREISHLKAKI
ncbi:rod shape-determining protein MreD [Thermodesulfobacteriota bacterium]